MKRKNKIMIAIMSLIIFYSGIFFNLFLTEQLQSQLIDVGQPIVTYQDQDASTDNLQHLIHEVQKSVVQINVETDYSERSGSGFLYNSRGDIVTNAHVIEDATSIQVTMS